MAIIPQLAPASEDRASGAQVIDGSLKFSNIDQHLKKTITTAGNRRTWTFSCWAKRSSTGSVHRIMSSGADSDNYFLFEFSDDNYIKILSKSGGSNVIRAYTSGVGAVYRDIGWYSLVLAVDTTQSTAADRIKLYVNGESVALLLETTPAQNLETEWLDTANTHKIGQNGWDSAGDFDGYLSQAYMIDGVALSASYFGYTDPLTGTWRPKKFIAEGTTVNNGTQWSSDGDNTNINSSYPWTKAFDGVADGTYGNGAGADDGDGWARWTPTGGVVVKDSLRINTDNGTTSAVKVKFSGAGVQHLTSLTDGWNNVSRDGSILEYIEIYNQSTTWSYLCAVEVDGIVMIDSTTQNLAYGTNGFYFPFDGNTLIGKDQSGKGNDWTPVNFGGSTVIPKATGALPILNTVSGGKVATVGVRTDPYYANLVLALPLDGNAVDVSNQINSGSSTKTMTANGNAAASTAQSDFYGGSYYFDGNGDYLSTPDSTDWHLGTSEFTIECFIRKTANGTNNYDAAIATGVNGSYHDGWSFLTSTGDDAFRTYDGSGGGGMGLEFNNNSFTTDGKWHHIAVSRDSSNVARLFLDGIIQDEETWNFSIPDSSTPLYVGAQILDPGNVTFGFNGYIQDVRIYKGTAKYTSNFIPASTDPDILPETPSGVAYKSELTKPTSGAVAFDGNGDYLSLASTSDFDFGTGDFTIELWAYCEKYSGSPYFFDFRTDGSDTGTTNKIVWYVPSSSGKPTFWANGSSRIVADNTIALDAWVHLALVRSSGTTKMYINGSTQSSTYSDTTDYGDGGSPLIIGQREGTASQSWPGFISNVRIVKGTALYTANFTPPTSPLTNITNTKLLCCQGGNAGEGAVAPTISGINDGTVWSSGWATPSGGWHSSGGAVNSFDGSTTTYTSANSTATAFKWTNPGSLSGVLRIYADATNSGNGAAIKVNGTQVTTMIATQWYSLGTFNSGIDSIEIVPESGNRGWVYAIEVGGTVLVDPILANGNAIAASFNPFDTANEYVLGKATGYCTLNPLDTNFGSNLQDGNLKAVGSSNWSAGHARGTFALTSGKWYWEGTKSGGSGAVGMIGFANKDASLSESYGSAPANSWTFYFGNGTEIIVPAANCAGYFSGSAMTDGETAAVALDMDNGTWQFFKNGVGGDVKTLVDTDSGSTASITELYPWVGAYSSNVDVNFGQTPFKYPPPEGFFPLCNANLPNPGVTRPDKYFTPTLYTGSGSGAQYVSAGFKPDMVWIKSRSNAWWWNCFDSVRGSGKEGTDDAAYMIGTNGTTAQSQVNAVSGTQFQGFYGGDTYGGYIPHYYTGGSGQELNTSGATYVGYCWKAGGGTGAGGEFWKDDKQYASAAAAGLDNTSGGSTGTDSKFAILRYTGTGSEITMGHSLGATPAFAIHKCISHSGDWTVWHDGLGSLSNILILNNTGSLGGMSSGITSWNSTQLVMDTDGGVNTSGRDYLLYLWANVPGVQKFGKFEGNSANDGTYVDLGFRPALLILKNMDNGSAPWYVLDNKRSPYNEVVKSIQAQSNGGEATDSNFVDFLSNGFKMRTSGAYVNQQTMIYMAWAEAPYHNLYGGQSNAR